MNHKQFSSRGGKARAKKLSKTRKIEIASRGAQKRWEQYGGDGLYHLISHGKKVNQCEMTRKDAMERNKNRKMCGVQSRWFWVKPRQPRKG